MSPLETLAYEDALVRWPHPSMQSRLTGGDITPTACRVQPSRATACVPLAGPRSERCSLSLAPGSCAPAASRRARPSASRRLRRADARARAAAAGCRGPACSTPHDAFASLGASLGARVASAPSLPAPADAGGHPPWPGPHRRCAVRYLRHRGCRRALLPAAAALDAAAAAPPPPSLANAAAPPLRPVRCLRRLCWLLLGTPPRRLPRRPHYGGAAVSRP